MIAAFSVGYGGARYGVIYPPCGILHVVAAINRVFPGETKVYSQPLLGLDEEALVELAVKELNPVEGALVAIPTEMDYRRGLKLIEALKKAGINKILVGGFPFTVPFSQKPYYAAVNRQVLVCDTDGEVAAVAFVEYCYGKKEAEEIPNVWLPNGKRTTLISPRPIHKVEYPLLPFAVWDPRPAWETGHQIPTEVMASKLIGRPIRAWDLIWTGSFCSLAGRQGRDPETGLDRNRCDYCGSGSRRGVVGASKFWEKMQACLGYIHLAGISEAVKIRLTADDYGNLRPIIRQIGDQMPSWICQQDYCFELYAWGIGDLEHALELRRIGTVQVYIGADGKGYKPELDGPYIRSLRFLQQAGLLIHTAFIPGKYNETWDSLDAWLKLAEHVKQEFGDALSFLGGYLIWVIPGSWDWHRVIEKYPELALTDDYDLEEIRRRFWRDFTYLGNGLSNEVIFQRLEGYTARFNALSPLPGQWSFGRR